MYISKLKQTVQLNLHYHLCVIICHVNTCTYFTPVYNVQERRCLDLVEYGTPHGYTAMAKCVGLPTAIAARLILDGQLHIDLL